MECNRHVISEEGRRILKQKWNKNERQKTPRKVERKTELSNHAVVLDQSCSENGSGPDSNMTL